MIKKNFSMLKFLMIAGLVAIAGILFVHAMQKQEQTEPKQDSALATSEQITSEQTAEKTTPAEEPKATEPSTTTAPASTSELEKPEGINVPTQQEDLNAKPAETMPAEIKEEKKQEGLSVTVPQEEAQKAQATQEDINVTTQTEATQSLPKEGEEKPEGINVK